MLCNMPYHVNVCHAAKLLSCETGPAIMPTLQCPLACCDALRHPPLARRLQHPRFTCIGNQEAIVIRPVACRQAALHMGASLRKLGVQV